MNKTAGVITVSTRCSTRTYSDKSGPLLIDLLKQNGFETPLYRLVTDDIEQIKQAILELSKECSLIITTGGTGLAPSDVTPEATLAVSQKVVPGIAEEIRRVGIAHNPNSMISRSVAVVYNHTLIINFPGSPKACSESFEVVHPILNHAIGLISGEKMDK